MTSQHMPHMHKALTQMNVQVHHVISDLTGLTGLAIIDAIIAGERNPAVAGQTAGSAHQSQRGNHSPIAGGQLACGASVYAQAIAPELPTLPGADYYLR